MCGVIVEQFKRQPIWEVSMIAEGKIDVDQDFHMV
jgi:hypothetical protein